MYHCTHFPRCGGCTALDTDYAKQLDQKKEKLKSVFSSFNISTKEIIASPEPFFYRHKVQLPFAFDKRGGLILGCYGLNSHAVINQERCFIQDKDLSVVVSAVRDWAIRCRMSCYNEKNGTGFLRHVLLRKGAGTGEILIGLVTNGEWPEGSRYLSNKLLEMLERRISPKSRVVGIVQNVNTRRTNVVLGDRELCWWGRPYLKETLGLLKFKVGLSTFFQVNPSQIPNLYNEVLHWVPQGSRVFDLYSGMGSIALWISSRAAHVTGIEENRASVSAAGFAAKLNGITNVKFLAGDTAQLLPETASKGYTVAVIDPPRKGLDTIMTGAVLASSLERLIYVSCNPETLARDLSFLKSEFNPVSLQGFDMFPHTDHIECVAVLDRILRRV